MKAPTVWRESGAKIALKETDWLGSGGEGSVWRVDASCALKIAEDPAAFGAKAQKIRLLSGLSHPGLVTPEGLALDAAGSPVGYFMPLVKGEPLARYFSTSWQSKNAVDSAALAALAERMRLAIEALHAAGVAGGDINEFNWMVERGSPRLFDSDSWGVGGIPVSAMMPSIADPLANGRYGPSSDWFAYAVLAFQLFIGAHPYRGSHPDFARQDMAGRMRSGASLFDPKASPPPSARSLDAIPPGLSAWLKGALSNAHRDAPPPASAWSKAPAPANARPFGAPGAAPAGALSLKAQETLRLPSRFERWIGSGVALLADGSALDLASRSRVSAPAGALGALRLSDGSLGWTRFDPALGALSLSAGSQSAQFKAGPGSRCETLHGRLFVIKEGSWQEIAVRKLASALLLAPCASGAASMVSATSQDGGLLLPSLGGATLLRPGPAACQGLSALRAPQDPSARLIGSASCPGFDAFCYRDAQGASLSQLFIQGKPAGSAPAGAIAAFRLGPSSVLCLFDSGEAALLDGAGARWGHFEPLWAQAQAFAGSVWAPSDDGLSLLGASPR